MIVYNRNYNFTNLVLNSSRKKVVINYQTVSKYITVVLRTTFFKKISTGVQDFKHFGPKKCLTKSVK